MRTSRGAPTSARQQLTNPTGRRSRGSVQLDFAFGATPVCPCLKSQKGFSFCSGGAQGPPPLPRLDGPFAGSTCCLSAGRMLFLTSGSE